MTEKFNNGALDQEASDREVQAAIREAAVSFLEAHLPDFTDRMKSAPAKRGLLAVILETAGRPVRLSEIKDIMGGLADRVGRGVAMTNVSPHLKTMKDQGRAQLLERGVYAHAGLDCRGYEKSMKIGENILAALDAGEAPLTAKDIKDYCLSHARRPISHQSVDTALRTLRLQGKIRRLHANAYAPAGFDVESYEQPLTNPQLVARILAENARPMTVGDVKAALGAMGRPDVSNAGVSNSLHRLHTQERIRRLERGVYARLEFDPGLYRPATAGIGSMVLEALDAELKPMTTADVVAAVNRIFDQRKGRETVNQQLNKLARRGKVKKLGKGVYASLGCDEAVFRSAATTATKTRAKTEKKERVAPKRPPKNEDRPVATPAVKPAKPERKRKKKPARKPAAKRPTAIAKVREKIRLLDAIDDELTVEGVVVELEKDGLQVSETLRSFIGTLLERRNGDA